MTHNQALRTRTTARRRWLCIAYAFPPIQRSGTHRTLGFVRHLCEWGWDATVLTVKPGEERVDEALSVEVPASVRIVRTPWTDLVAKIKQRTSFARASRSEPVRGLTETVPSLNVDARARGFRDWITRALQTPDSRVGWLVPAVRAGIRAVREDRAEVIYSTSPYATAHLIALMIASRTKKPWVADFRDPWTDNPFRDVPYASLQWWDGFLETRVLRRASRILCASPTITDRIIERFPTLRGKCTTILNGFDPAPFERITPIRDEDTDACVLVHAGQFYGSRRPGVWFDALRSACGVRSDARPIRLHLIGRTCCDGRSLNELADNAGVGHAVRVLGERPHAETLARVAGADGVLLPTSQGSGAQLQIPNKLFESLALRRPIIAAADIASPVRSILRRAGADAAVLDPDDVTGIAEAMRSLAANGRLDQQATWTGVDEFSRVHRARELLGIFEELLETRAVSEAQSGPFPTGSGLRTFDPFASPPKAGATAT